MKKDRKPKCNKCWDKGFFSELAVQRKAADFIGDKSYSGTLIRKNFCVCLKGKRLRKNAT